MASNLLTRWSDESHRTVKQVRCARHRSTVHRRHVHSFVEQLEPRRLLDAASTTPAILGTVYEDANNDMQFTVGEQIQGATVRLYEDDGDGVFEPGTDDAQFGGDLSTDANGDYCFDGLDLDASYFVQQPAQTASGVTLLEQVSALQTPGSLELLIDAFVTTQSATASPPAPSNSTAVIAFANESEVIGAERDMAAFLDAGDGEVSVSVNPFGARETLRYNSDVAVTGRGVITWDGVDVDAGTTTMGLNGRDLTDGGRLTGIAMQVGAVLTGATARVRLYQGNDLNFSDATVNIPVTTGGAADAYQFVPFSSFFGPVSADNVDAIELVLDANDAGGNDLEMSRIGANGPRRVDFANMVGVDLEVTKTDGRAEAVPGESLTYTVVVTNNGPSDVSGAEVTDVMPNELQEVTYTSTTSGMVSGNTPAGSGDINDTIDITAGSAVTYTITGTVDPAATGTIQNTASVVLPNGLTDSQPENNNAVDNDTLTPQADLAIAKTDNHDRSMPGSSLTYTITASNDGPSDAPGTAVNDAFPSELTVNQWTSSATGGAAGNSPNGTGDISEMIDMPAGSTVVYTVDAIVNADAAGPIENTATITPDNSVTDTNTNNNLSTDSNSVSAEADLVVSKTDNQSTVSTGDSVVYEIVVQNEGPSDVNGAQVTDVLPAGLRDGSFTSQAADGATGNTSGSGDIQDMLNLPAGSQVTYTFGATVEEDASGTITNTATVTMPAGITEVDSSNNTAVDTNTIEDIRRSISGFVYVDTDNDGAFDTDEQPILGVELTLSGTDLTGAPVSQTVHTDHAGRYRFRDLRPGTYNVVQTQPAAFRDGQATPGSGSTMAVTVGDNQFLGIGLASVVDVENFNFGERRSGFSKRVFLASRYQTG